tara:strand:- start:56 stop:1444 length:1389 start_codon:yes stop_codon:yes gene_type:complete
MSEIKVNKLSSRTGNAVTLGTSGDTLTIPAGVTLTNSGTATGFGSDSDISWQSVVTSNTTMVAGRGYFVNTTSGGITMTLPASPSAGDIVAIKDYARTFGTNNVTVNRNSSPMDGTTSNLTLDTDGLSVTIVYMDDTKGWSFINQDTTTSTGLIYTAATGGTVKTVGDFKTHIFTTSSNFVVSQAGVGEGTQVDYLVVAGGAGGGTDRGAGGGAGGMRLSDSLDAGHPLASGTGISVSAQTYPITVGGGGAAGQYPTSSGNGGNGSQSVFSTITSAGGGGGGNANNNSNGDPGGSGGGASDDDGAGGTGGTGNTPPVSPAQGNDGGPAASGAGGGGGGGAGAAGASGPAPSDNGGAGGVGAYVPDGFIGPDAPSYGTPGPESSTRYFAGGGGGGSRDTVPSTGGTGGSGGGGAGGESNPSTAGAAGSTNTGGGAGGGGNSPGSGGTSSSGGSGIVMIRYRYQ